MIRHGFAHAEFLEIPLVLLSKCARSDFSSSGMYRSVAISSLLSQRHKFYKLEF